LRDAGDKINGNFGAVNAELMAATTALADLGTAAHADAGDFATAGQGATADSAVQPGDRQLVSALASNALTVNLKAWHGTAAEYAALTPIAGELYLVRGDS
ncbi:MAG: hypothetical protein ACREH3_14075, partial [Geminicoccales bacterium]